MAHFDLCVIGSGSGNSLIDERFADRSVALIDKGVLSGTRTMFGGTCLNVGCIPTKMFVLPADLAAAPGEAGRLGVDLDFVRVRWPKIRDRIFGRIDAISAAGLDWREQNPHVTVFQDSTRFTGPRTLEVAGEEITADQVVIAAGSRAVLPPVPGLDDERLRAVGSRSRGVHTSDTVMRIDRLPDSIVIMGGGFVSAEFAHVFASFGTQVTVVARSAPLLRHEDHEIAQRFTAELSRRVDVRTGTVVDSVEALADERVAVTLGDGDRVEADLVLVATGRVPNGDTLNLPAAGVDCDEQGFVVVDEFQRTSAEGVFALGDVCSHAMLKHVANAEARTVQHNLLHPDDLVATDHRFVPHAVFSHPQVASVGLTEEQAVAEGIDHVTAVQEYGGVAYGWALEDEGHCVKLLADPASGLLLGAHLVGPQASTLIQPLIQAMSFGLDARSMARGQYWIHPALSEVVENALLALPLSPAARG